MPKAERIADSQLAWISLRCLPCLQIWTILRAPLFSALCRIADDCIKYRRWVCLCPCSMQPPPVPPISSCTSSTAKVVSQNQAGKIKATSTLEKALDLNIFDFQCSIPNCTKWKLENWSLFTNSSRFEHLQFSAFGSTFKNSKNVNWRWSQTALDFNIFSFQCLVSNSKTEQLKITPFWE